MTYLLYNCLIFGTIGIGVLAQKHPKQVRILVLVFGVLAFLMMQFLFKVTLCYILFNDFRIAYYPAGQFILSNPSSIYQEAFNGRGVSGFVNIPIFALLFVPFSSLPEFPSGFIFTILGILTILVTCYFISKFTGVLGWRCVLLVGFFAVNGPLLYSLKIGNFTHFLLPLLLAAFFCLEKKLEVWLGVLVAIAALSKPPLLILGIYFVLRRRWRVLLSMCTTLLGVIATSLFLFGIELHRTWFQQCILPYLGKPVPAFNVQSVDSFLGRLFASDNLMTLISEVSPTTWLPMEVDWHFKLVRYVLLSLLIGGVIWICWRSKLPTTVEVEHLEFSIFLCLSLVISPISWTHYYLLLLLPFSLYLGQKLAIPNAQPWLNWIILAVLLTSQPVIFLTHLNPVFKPLVYKFFISHYFLGGILFLGILLYARWYTSHSQFHKSVSLSSETVMF